jgi:HPr kinase/phosphorylase
MATVTLKCLMARNKDRLGVTGGAGRAGLAKKVNRVRGLSGLVDELFLSTLSPTTLLVIDSTAMVAGYPTTTAGSDAAPRERRRKFLKSLQSASIPCLALPGVDDIPDFLVHFAEQTSTYVFGSGFDENLLTSRLLGLLHEKLHGRFFVQGALVNVFGRGVLITGESGAGKTTLALELAGRGHKWIADDAVEIEKRRGGCLAGRSQAMVKNLLEIKEIGVLSVRDVLPAASIADQTPVDMVVEIHRDARPCVSTPYWGRPVSTIMGGRLPLLKIPLSYSANRGEQLENAVSNINQAG